MLLCADTQLLCMGESCRRKSCSCAGAILLCRRRGGSLRALLRLHLVRRRLRVLLLLSHGLLVLWLAGHLLLPLCQEHLCNAQLVHAQGKGRPAPRLPLVMLGNCCCNSQRQGSDLRACSGSCCGCGCLRCCIGACAGLYPRCVGMTAVGCSCRRQRCTPALLLLPTGLLVLAVLVRMVRALLLQVHPAHVGRRCCHIAAAATVTATTAAAAVVHARAACMAGTRCISSSWLALLL
jgi:hypothetical protein